MINWHALTTSVFQYLNSEQTLLYKWQDLLGAVIGVFGTFLVAICGFYLRHLWNSYSEVRNNIRKTEIALALTLHNIYDNESHLKDFLVRVNRAIIHPVKQLQEDVYFIGKTNFPSLQTHLDASLVCSRFKSYYVRNKLLVIHKNLDQSNRTFVDMREDYNSIFETSKYLISTGISKKEQREQYLQNHESFVTFVKDIIRQMQIAKKILAETKTVNLKYLKKQRFAIWKLESTSFKYFRKKEEEVKYRSSYEAIERIDKAIFVEVEEQLREQDQLAEDAWDAENLGIQDPTKQQ
ncbi:MAG: hypothetical protein AAB618_01045 [Patescibacteria group bacterium]